MREELLLQVKKLAKHNELKVVSFLIVENESLNNVKDVFSKLGNAFIDISNEEDSVEQWRSLKKYDNASMICFNTEHSIFGEMELIFKNNKLVQSGAMTFYENEQKEFLDQLFNAIRGIIGLNFHIINQSDHMVFFSNNKINGYLSSANMTLSFRLADLKYCEGEYGSNISVKV